MKRSPLRRRSPLRARKCWRHQPDLERQRRRFERQYGSEERVAWLKGYPCVSCGRVATDASHVRHGPLKTADETVPQCHRCHLELHAAGIQTFQQRYQVDLGALAKRFAERWRQHESDAHPGT